MADDENTTQANPGSGDGDGPPRETTSGRYVSRHDESAKGDDDDKDKEEPEGKKRWLLLLLLLLLILLLLICAGAAYMRWWNKDDPAATPSPTVATTTSAPQTSPSPSVSPSVTASPSPSPSAARTVAMPNVVGMQASQAKTVLESAGFTNIKFVDEAKPSDSLSILASFVVTKQSVPAGTQVAVDTALTITCATSSNGKG